MRRQWSAVVALVLLSLGTWACSPQASTKKERDVSTPFALNVDRKNFDATSTTLDNTWWPLKVGTRLTWEGRALDGEDEIERRIVFTVTDLTKEIGGIQTVVGWDRDFNDDTLVESELIFLAKDKLGNVWHFGQYAEIYDEEGQFDGGSAWIAGYLEGAKAGILMQAQPETKRGVAYSEGFAPPPFFWDDYGRVVQTGQRTCVEAGCYTDVLVIEEYEPSKPGAFQLKYYAPNVGLVRVGWRGENEEEQEELELVRVEQLTPAQLAEARTHALELEKRAALYGATAASQHRPAASPTT